MSLILFLPQVEILIDLIFIFYSLGTKSNFPFYSCKPFHFWYLFIFFSLFFFKLTSCFVNSSLFCANPLKAANGFEHMGLSSYFPTSSLRARIHQVTYLPSKIVEATVLTSYSCLHNVSQPSSSLLLVPLPNSINNNNT